MPTSDSEAIRAGTNVPAMTPHVDAGFVGPVRAFWGDTDDGPFTARLSFRVGEADERLRTRGRCHLVTALALDGLDIPEVTVTASITTLRTRFTATGSDEGVAAAVTAIARRLSALRSDRAVQLAPSVMESWRPPERWDTDLMSLRFGSRGYGLPALPLLGLDDIDVAGFDDWARNWFNASNAVIAMNRRSPDGLDLGALGDGITKPLPPPNQLERELPAIATGVEGRLAVSFLTRFDATAGLLYDLVIDRIHARCIGIDPRIARPTPIARRTGTGLATIGMSIVAPDEVLGAVHAAISSEMFGLAMNGPTVDELDRARIALRRTRQFAPSHRRPGVIDAAVDEAAVDHLFGEDRDLGAAFAADPVGLAKIMRDAVTRAIWLVPEAAGIVDHRLVPIRTFADEPVSGTIFRASPDRGDVDDRIIVSDAGITIVHGVTTLTIEFSDLVAVQVHPDGSRTLWGVDGSHPRIVPTDWVDGRRIVEAVDAGADPWVVIHTDATTEAIRDTPET
ncbi:MAG: hypothetical protein JST73_04685 [Actinobacteria bacterium]|nr:hypothetical protein [Actinomycetota bacterium]